MFVFTIKEVLMGIIVLILALTYLVAVARQSIKQMNCHHKSGVTETSSCDAICNSCGKNLGFIGSDENKVRRAQ